MSWTAHEIIRTRREALALSQSALSDLTGIPKSLLSLIEAGKRRPTAAQGERLAEVLQIPSEFLLLGAGRLPEDVLQAFDTNAADVVSAVRQVIEARVVAYPALPTVLPLQKTTKAPIKTTRVPERINVRKTSTSYRAHSYHTKVPPEAIRPFIAAHSRPGETIFDPFCGSGMTGVAALMESRHALLSDVSPAAVHISRNYTTPCNPKELSAAIAVVTQQMAPIASWLYRPVGQDTTVEYMTWSDVYRCPKCSAQTRYWDAMRRGGIDGDRLSCAGCRVRLRKSEFEWVGEEAVESHTSAGSTRVNAHAPTREELALIEESARIPIPYWVPSVPFGPEREMWRAGHRSMGISDIAGFFTRRNLHALAALRHSIIGAADGRVREALLFAFTAAVNRASRRYQWNAKRPTNVMTGTLYISSLRYEWNVWSLFRRKAADVLRYYESFPKTSTAAQVFQRSATDLDCLPDRSADMIFMDPPFGSNIFYADSSLLWEAWLGELTDPASEIVVNKHRTPASGGKKVEDYSDLMRASFAQAARILKPGGRAILAFSNSDDRVWKSIQDALREAGFEAASTHVLNKGQPSIKGVKGVSGKENVTTLDVLLCLQHRKGSFAIPPAAPTSPALVEGIVRASLDDLVGKRIDEIYTILIGELVASNRSVSGITMPGIADLCRALGAQERDGRWALTTSHAPKAGPASFVDGYLKVDGTLPRTSGSQPTKAAFGAQQVAGGRNSALYLAHSYHTKVPPESITPFIEHFTKEGDVVLDPFCGSGMTGVAAALSNRRAILNDLAPAAIHLAWNHVQPADASELAAAFSTIESRLSKRLGELYGTNHTDGSPARIHWTLWSTRYQCPSCSRTFLLWEVMDRETGRLGKEIRCPHCKSELRRSAIKALGSEPAWIAYETKDGRRFEKEPDAVDRDRALSFTRDPIDVWYPTTRVNADREMYIRCALQLQGIDTVADFYTPRNLEALARIWHEIVQWPDDRIKRALAFAFTNTAWHGTRMRRFNARGGQRPLTGTLYIPQLSSEANVLEVMRNKINQLRRYYRSYNPRAVELPALLLGSAAKLPVIADNSIDYVFTDPPFGSNIFYADCNLIWEAWLGRLTDASQEAVINRSLSEENGGKSILAYADVVGSAMREIARVLKPGGWATVVFHNTDAAVWQALRDAADTAGFEFHEAATLDRKQQSHKGYKGRSGEEDVAHFDVVFNLRKPMRAGVIARPKTTRKINLPALVASVSNDPEVRKRGLQGVHAEVMRHLASQQSASFFDYAEIRSLVEKALAAAKSS